MAAHNVTPAPYLGTFLHGIDLNNPHVCWNVSLAEALWSPDFIALTEGWPATSHVSFRETPLDTLRDSAHEVVGTTTPRGSMAVYMAWMLRQGFTLSTDGKALDDRQKERILRIADVELDFERVRREMAPNAPSRLSSLYLADDTSRGEAHIRDMLRGARLLVTRVEVPIALRAGRYDTEWIDAYAQRRDEDLIHRYWAGDSHQGKTWEHLVEGYIRFVDAADLELLRQEGARWQGIAPDTPLPRPGQAHLIGE